MKKKSLKQIKETAKEVYMYLLETAGSHEKKYDYRELILSALKAKNKEEELKRIGLKGDLVDRVLSVTDTEENANIFTSYMFLDWTGFFTYDQINLYTLRKFFEERPALSLSAISSQAGLSDKYLRLVLAEERGLTDNVIQKLKPVLLLYGWGDRPTKSN